MAAQTDKTSASQTKQGEETVMKPEDEALKFVEVVPDDTYNGYLILKRGPVVVNESLLGAGDVR